MCHSFSVCVSVLVCGELTSSTFPSFWFHCPPFYHSPVLLPSAPGLCLCKLCVLAFSYCANRLHFLEWGFVTLSELLVWPSNSLKHTFKHTTQTSPNTWFARTTLKWLQSIFLYSSHGCSHVTGVAFCDEHTDMYVSSFLVCSKHQSIN